MNNITGLTVFYQTSHLIDISLKSFRVYYPDVPLIIVNNSPLDHECTQDLIDFVANDDGNSTLVQLELNYGHGPALNRGMEQVETDYVYIFDSDSEIIKEDMLEGLAAEMNSKTYGVGFTRLTSRGGSHRDGGSLEDPDVMTYMHPLACLISVNKYKEFPPFSSGGAPFNKTMSAIKDTGISDLLIKYFPVIGLDRGRVNANYIKHHGGSTRARYGICSPHVGE